MQSFRAQLDYQPGLRLSAVSVACALGLAALATSAQDGEPSFPYFEDDAWWDVTERLEGNDYNSANESWFELDTEQQLDPRPAPAF